ncbi:MAG: 60S ribosomal protein L22 [Candidatus Bathyarchaeota archaeon]|nr:60S ribosomal protein L22 [Candidatus Bathyarchaeota archaeon]
MAEIVIDASGLKNEGNEAIQALVDFVKEKTGAEVTADGLKLTVKGEGAAVSKKYLRVVVKKFLHKRELKEGFRVISDNEEENTLKVKERKTYEEE